MVTKERGSKRSWLVVVVIAGVVGLLYSALVYLKMGAETSSGGPPKQGFPAPSGQPPQLRYRVVEVAFGTDRGASSGASQSFGASRAIAVSVGMVKVAIPYSHKMGEIERPSLFRLEIKEDPNKHVVLLSIDPLGPKDFSNFINSASGKKAFVFVHGYKTTFDDAALRTAQMAVDFGMKLFPAFFSWPSQGSLASYTVDEANAEWTEPHLAQFLMLFAEQSNASEVVVIAHSMGTRAVTRALTTLLAGRPDLRPRFRELILAAPDIDAEVFKRDLLPRIVASKQRVTLYASSNDKALKASKQVHGSPRAGESGQSLVVAPGLETIDASSIDTDFLGHSYFAESRPLLTDLELLVSADLRADRRPTLENRSIKGQQYWSFRP